MTTTRTITKIRRRLERAELDLLREVVADQAARIEALEAELDEARRAADWADTRADMFHALALETEAVIGITCSGDVGVIHSNAAH